MKINENFVLRQVADVWCVLQLREGPVDLKGLLTLNETGVFLWNLLEKGSTENELADKMLEEYEVTREHAAADIKEFIGKLQHIGCLDE